MVNNLEREKNFTSSKKASLPLKKNKKENQIDKSSTKRWKKKIPKRFAHYFLSQSLLNANSIAANTIMLDLTLFRTLFPRRGAFRMLSVLPLIVPS